MHLSQKSQDGVSIALRSNNAQRNAQTIDSGLFGSFLDVEMNSETFRRRAELATNEWRFGEPLRRKKIGHGTHLRRAVRLEEALNAHGIHVRPSRDGGRVALASLRRKFAPKNGSHVQYDTGFKVFTYKENKVSIDGLKKYAPAALIGSDLPLDKMLTDITRCSVIDSAVKWQADTAVMLSDAFAEYEAKEGKEKKIGAFKNKVHEAISKYLKEHRGKGCCHKTTDKLCELKIEKPELEFGYICHRGGRFLSNIAEHRIALEVSTKNAHGVPVFKQDVIQFAKELETVERSEDKDRIENWNKWYRDFVQRSRGYYGKLNIVEKSRKDWCTSENLEKRTLDLAQQLIEIGYAEATGRFKEYLEKRREGDDSKFIFKKGEVLVEWNPDVLARILNFDETRLPVSGKLIDNYRSALCIPINHDDTEEHALWRDASPSQRDLLEKDVATTQSRAISNNNVFSLLACVNAEGSFLAPAYCRPAKMTEDVFPRDHFKVNNLVIPGQEPAYYHNKKGSFDGPTFLRWFKEIFLPAVAALDAKAREENKVIPENRGVLFMDSCPSHFISDFLELASKEKIKVLCFVPYTTHACQPLDVTLFAPFKRHFKIYLMKSTEKSRVITGRDVIEQSIVAMNAAWTAALIISSWASVGLKPFDARVLHEQKEKEEREAQTKEKVSSKKRRNPFSDISNTIDGATLRHYDNINLTPESANSLTSGDKENITREMMKEVAVRTVDETVKSLKRALIACEVCPKTVRAALNHKHFNDFDPLTCVPAPERPQKKACYKHTGATVFLDFNGDATRTEFIALQKEKDAKKVAKQEKVEARKELKEVQAHVKRGQYKELREQILKLPKNGSFKLNNEQFNLLWFGLMAENAAAKQAFSEFLETNEIRNTQVLTTPVILDLIAKSDTRFYKKINAVCTWQKRRCVKETEAETE